MTRSRNQTWTEKKGDLHEDDGEPDPKMLVKVLYFAERKGYGNPIGLY